MLGLPQEEGYKPLPLSLSLSFPICSLGMNQPLLEERSEISMWKA